MHAAPLVGVLCHVLLEPAALELHHAEHQGHGLDGAVGLAADLERRAGQRGDVPVARTVDHRFGLDHDGSRLRLEHDPTEAPAADDVGGESVQQQLDAHFVQHVEGDELEDLGIEGDDEPRLLRGRDRAAGADEALE